MFLLKQEMGEKMQFCYQYASLMLCLSKRGDLMSTNGESIPRDTNAPYKENKNKKGIGDKKKKKKASKPTLNKREHIPISSSNIIVKSIIWTWYFKNILMKVLLNQKKHNFINFHIYN